MDNSHLNDLLERKKINYVLVRLGQGMTGTKDGEDSELRLIDKEKIHGSDEAEYLHGYARLISNDAYPYFDAVVKKQKQLWFALDAPMWHLRKSVSQFKTISGKPVEECHGKEIHITQLVEVDRAGPESQKWPYLYVFKWQPMVLRIEGISAQQSN